ncbi:MAG: VOC family protein [Clostridiales bacterium]|jgi:lactoylglutathione lyase|nr:VOC family protein [Clostridiales bacterium]
MRFKMVHNNFNVQNLEKSVAFYEEALQLKPVREKHAQDGSFKIVWLGDTTGTHQLELTWLSDHSGPYDLGENETHLAFETDDMAAAHALHERLGCICYENPAMGIYFISDPDNYWLEIVPKR